MTISISKLKPGDVVFDCHRERMGNTTMTRLGVWKVVIVEVHENHVVARWNGNPAKGYWARDGKFSWRRFPPEWVPGAFFGDGYRCYMCHAKEREGLGHRAGCPHPKARKAQKGGSDG